MLASSSAPYVVYYSTDPGRMEGWVDLVGWMIADALPGAREWSHVEPAVWGGSGKTHQLKPVICPLGHPPATYREDTCYCLTVRPSVGPACFTTNCVPPFLPWQHFKLAQLQRCHDVQFITVLLHAELFAQPHAVFLDTDTSNAVFLQHFN